MTKTQFCTLINEYQLSLFRLAKSILKNDADAEDAVGETILKSYAKLHTLKDESSFRPWIFRILINEAYAAAKRRSKVICMEDAAQAEQAGFSAGGLPGSASYADGGPSAADLREAVDQLEEEFRIVTLLFYYEDLSLKDIASALRLPEGTVKSRLSRARRQLRAMLDDKGE
ncbi:RNA polymerase sigma factor [Bacilliculturomica massiliensis]|uniref:RNA polymerase sigma factor n=1 Tax=Bacilliculturomica massiliensis TaxID=1917867 RepID=UPI0010306678|nr:sigma-70 family RNA polymerase sigma factor [Bacilliculturomica massiliensis]